MNNDEKRIPNEEDIKFVAETGGELMFTFNGVALSVVRSDKAPINYICQTDSNQTKPSEKNTGREFWILQTPLSYTIGTPAYQVSEEKPSLFEQRNSIAIYHVQEVPRNIEAAK